jgi:hypothetical protein
VKNEILVGEIVDVWLNVEYEAFNGRVLAINKTLDPNSYKWYKIKPVYPASMPGTFWYKENKVRKKSERIPFDCNRSRN